MSDRYYTGVGSRETPPEILGLMTAIAQSLRARWGFTLRSGGARGADLAFAKGARQGARIYRPADATPVCYQIAAMIHPRWDLCDDVARGLHARNVLQVLGDDLKTPSEFLVCWTPDGAQTRAQTSRETGGTATAIAVACESGVPVFNLRRPEAMGLLRAKVLAT